MRDSPPEIAYAKNPEHERHLQRFEGRLKGRYLLSFLAGVQVLGGEALRAEIEQELGHPTYRLDEWYTARDMILILDRSLRAGLDLARMGELVLPAYKRAHPKQFEGKSVEEAFDIMERGFREDTTYGGVSPGHEVEPGHVRLYRTDSPTPCEFFVGVVRGLLKVFDIEGSVREVRCQWDGEAESCSFEARFETPG